jgi:ribonuclease VapC
VIVIDTSALMAIVLDEPQADPCMAVIEQNRDLAISAGTLAESLIVATRRGVGAAMEQLITDLTLDTVPVTAAAALRVVAAYARWGRGIHRAALNFGDCFAYALAKEYRCPLLFVGNDFARTDVPAAAST